MGRFYSANPSGRSLFSPSALDPHLLLWHPALVLPFLPPRLLVFSILLLSAVGCDNACLDLCAAWYDFQDEACGAENTVDFQARCEDDYRSSGDSLLAGCDEILIEVNNLDATLGEAHPCCVEVSGEACTALLGGTVP